MKKIGCVIGLGLVVFVLLVGIWLMETYNKMVRLDQDVKEAWSQVEAQYQRRIDLIPNMVEVVKRYARHEQQIFKEIAEARTRYSGAKSSDEKIKIAGEMEGFLSRLMVIVENYPNLKANEEFIRLMDQWEGTENRIAVQRMRYNKVIKQYNYTAKSFVGRFWVGLFGFDKEKAYFEAEKGAEKAPSARDMFGKENRI